MQDQINAKRSTKDKEPKTKAEKIKELEDKALKLA